jgi:hypothetical protein
MMRGCLFRGLRARKTKEQRENRGRAHEDCADRQNTTYQDDAAHKYQVPQHVFSAREARTSHFHLHHVAVEEVRLENQAQLRASDEEGCHRAPYVRRQPQEELRAVVEVFRGEKAYLYRHGESNSSSDHVSSEGRHMPPGIDQILLKRHDGEAG